jgi:hypothetical protein
MSDPTPEQLPVEPDEDEEGRPVAPSQPIVNPDEPGAPKTPPGHEAEPGRRREDAPGQNKPEPDQGLPSE